MRPTETKTWRDKLTPDCVRQLEYRRRLKTFDSEMPPGLPDLIEFISSGGIERYKQFFDNTEDLTRAAPENYEEIEISEGLAEFVKTLGLGEPWDSLVPGSKKLPPNG